MRVVSWNVNGIRSAHKKGFAEWLQRCAADVVAIQEVRANPEQVPLELRADPTWFSSFHSAVRPGYSGVGLFSRKPPDELDTALGIPAFDDEGRVQMARLGKLLIVNSYFPNGNGKDRDLSRIPYKLRFYETLRKRLEPALQAGERILVVGDFNTAHEERDLARPKENQETSGFRPEERRAFSRWLEGGWVDTFRHFQPDGGHYSWWSQRFGARARNIGWRIDYVLASPGAMSFVRGAAIHPDVSGSDHCPVSVELAPKVR